MKRALLLIFALSGVAFPQETPKTMTKVEVILQSPEVPQGALHPNQRSFTEQGTAIVESRKQPTLIKEFTAWLSSVSLTLGWLI